MANCYSTLLSDKSIGISGGISVFKAVYIDKLALNCACVGGNSKAPLGIVSFTENAIMAIMGAALIFSATTGEAESVKIKEAEPNAIVQLQDASR
ncbi:glutaredoxin [Stanieria sp. NIES-3757]|nr:glutaredoxin [Stanieria sp. NIES-3757]